MLAREAVANSHYLLALIPIGRQRKSNRPPVNETSVLHVADPSGSGILASLSHQHQLSTYAPQSVIVQWRTGPRPDGSSSSRAGKTVIGPQMDIAISLRLRTQTTDRTHQFHSEHRHLPGRGLQDPPRDTGLFHEQGDGIRRDFATHNPQDGFNR